MTAAPATTPAAPRYRVRGLQIFRAGTYRDKPYSRQDLDDMVRNFRTFSTGPQPIHPVPGAFGHNEADLRRSDIPATGWTKRLWRDGDDLFIDQEDIAEPEAQALLSKRYGTVSPEIYDSPRLAGIEGSGKMLRRVCWLGGDVPHVKGMTPFKMPEQYRERGFAPAPRVLLQSAGARQIAAGLWACFSEVSTMPLDSAVSAETPAPVAAGAAAQEGPPDRGALMESLGSKHGVDTSKFDDRVPDHSLQEVHRALDAKDAEAHAEDMDGEIPAPEEGNQQQMNEYRAKARKFMERAKSYSGRAKAYAEKCGMKLDEERTVMPGQEEAERKNLAPATYAELRAAIRAELAASTDDARKFHEEANRSEISKGVHALVEDLVRTGRVPRSEAAGEERELLLLDRGTVHTFAENGKTVKESLYDARVRRLRGRSSHFAELIGGAPGGAAGGGGEGGADDLETLKVGQHYDAFKEFYPKTETKEGLVLGFKAARKSDPLLTAERFRGE